MFLEVFLLKTKKYIIRFKTFYNLLVDFIFDIEFSSIFQLQVLPIVRLKRDPEASRMAHEMSKGSILNLKLLKWSSITCDYEIDKFIVFR